MSDENILLPAIPSLKDKRQDELARKHAEAVRELLAQSDIKMTGYSYEKSYGRDLECVNFTVNEYQIQIRLSVPSEN